MSIVQRVHTYMLSTAAALTDICILLFIFRRNQLQSNNRNVETAAEWERNYRRNNNNNNNNDKRKNKIARAHAYCMLIKAWFFSLLVALFFHSFARSRCAPTDEVHAFAYSTMYLFHQFGKKSISIFEWLCPIGAINDFFYRHLVIKILLFLSPCCHLILKVTLLCFGWIWRMEIGLVLVSGTHRSRRKEGERTCCMFM